MNKTGLNRRTVLKGLTFSTATLSMGLPVLARESFPQLVAAPPDFLRASSALVGVDGVDLEPAIAQDDYSLANEYYSIMLQGCPSGLSQMLFYVQNNSLMPLQQLGDNLLRAISSEPGGGIRQDAIGTAARLTLQLWLFGIWYGSIEVVKNPNSITVIEPNYVADFVLSSRAYKSGWIWRFAQAHPMGFSQFGFGQWHDQPPSLQQYIPNTSF